MAFVWHGVPCSTWSGGLKVTKRSLTITVLSKISLSTPRPGQRPEGENIQSVSASLSTVFPWGLAQQNWFLTSMTTCLTQVRRGALLPGVTQGLRLTEATPRYCFRDDYSSANWLRGNLHHFCSCFFDQNQSHIGARLQRRQEAQFSACLTEEGEHWCPAQWQPRNPVLIWCWVSQ